MSIENELVLLNMYNSGSFVYVHLTVTYKYCERLGFSRNSKNIEKISLLMF